MKQMKFIFIIILILLLINISIPSRNADGTITGKILYTSMLSQNTYLINNDGTIINTWHSNYLPALSAYMLANGNILRPARLNIQQGGGGGIEEYTPNGELVWSFDYYSAGEYQTHHDIEPLPNGNILMLAWENIGRDQLISAGRDPNTFNDFLKSEHIIEVQPTGPNTGNIVWDWHAFDHLIQDYDPEKENYGLIVNHPELLDINYGTVSGDDYDWFHCNSIDYNEEFDQILISCRNFNEIWVIDHSTTTVEAASHAGGNSGKGGDLLYRWGNPQTYRIDTPCRLYEQHDASWIDSDCPGEGHILIFNNGVGRGYSSVDEIIPPIDSSGIYYYTPGTSFGPIDPFWSYTPPNFYQYRFSSAQRLRSGNTLICCGVTSSFFEVTPDMTIVWNYNAPQMGGVFKIAYIYPEEPNIEDLGCSGDISCSEVKPGTVITSSFKVHNIGLNDSLLDWTIESYPNWGTWVFTPLSATGIAAGDYTIVNVTVLTPSGKWKKFTGAIKIINSNIPSDFCEIDVSITAPRTKTITSFILLQRILQKYPNILQILTNILA